MLNESDPAYKEKEKLEIAEAFNQINNELNDIARKYAVNYIGQDDSRDIEQAFAVYKILLLPEDIFRIYLYNIWPN
jgi:hypothetical protein